MMRPVACNGTGCLDGEEEIRRLWLCQEGLEDCMAGYHDRRELVRERGGNPNRSNTGL